MNEAIINSLIGDLLKKSGSSNSNEKQQNDNYDGPTFTVNGVSFEMITVEGGTFTMGATQEQGSDADSKAKPTHQVTLSTYSIGQTEVTQALWVALMGSNPSRFHGNNLPVETVNWEDCQEFIRRLNNITGKHFRLPTEAEWEYAARGGKKSNGYKYSGSNTIDNVAWYEGNSNGQLYPVKSKSPNELGLYDMSGNVYEWCCDWYDDYGSASQTNPTGPSNGSSRVFRGGSWSDSAKSCRVSYRYGSAPSYRDYSIGFRLVLSEIGDMHNTSGASDTTSNQPDKKTSSFGGLLKNSGTIDSNEKQQNDNYDGPTFTVNGVGFEMITVEGGTFTMGATQEQCSDAKSDENPTHQVTLGTYRIGKTEVTQALWVALMGSNPIRFHDDNLPVKEVSWEDCQEFIRRLNNITGKHFRLPTEAEWEYAARGGKKSNGYKYSGSNTIDDVAWYIDNSKGKTHPVNSKSPNELGLYDMSGNVWEWCSDWYDDYNSASQTNPTGPSSGSCRVIRGGCQNNIAGRCRVTERYNCTPNNRFGNIGFRLALSE